MDESSLNPDEPISLSQLRRKSSSHMFEILKILCHVTNHMHCLNQRRLVDDIVIFE